MGKTERLLGLIDNINEWSGRIIGPLCLVMMAVLMWEITLRYFFNKPTIWAHELSGMLFGAYFILGGGYALRHQAHVNMDLFYSRLSPRGKALANLVGSLLFFIFCGLMLWKGVQMAWISLLARETTHSFWEPPWYPLKMTIPLGAFLILLQGLAWFIRSLTIAITGREAT